MRPIKSLYLKITQSIIDDLNIFVGKADQFDDITMLVISWQKDKAGSDG